MEPKGKYRGIVRWGGVGMLKREGGVIPHGRMTHIFSPMRVKGEGWGD